MYDGNTDLPQRRSVRTRTPFRTPRSLDVGVGQARKVIDNHRGYECPDGEACEELIIKCFIEQFIETEVVERVCIERAHQKLKIKGGRCKPFCKVESVAMHMCYPDEWDAVKKWLSDEKAKVS